MNWIKPIYYFLGLIIMTSCQNDLINEKIEHSIYAENNQGRICIYETSKYVFYKKCHENFYSLGILKSNLSINDEFPFHLYDIKTESSLDSATRILDIFYKKFDNAEIAGFFREKDNFTFEIYYKDASKKIIYNLKSKKWSKMTEWN